LVGMSLRPNLKCRIGNTVCVAHLRQEALLDQHVLQPAMRTHLTVRCCFDFVERALVLTQYSVELFLIFRRDVRARVNLYEGVMKGYAALAQTPSSARSQRQCRPPSQQE